MRLTSGRGNRGDASRRGDDGYAGYGAEPRGRTGLIGGGTIGVGTGVGTAGGGGRGGRGRRRSPGRRRSAWGRWLHGSRPGSLRAPVISVLAIVACAALVAAGIGVSGMLTAQPAANAAPDPNCTLIVPASPLTAQGLATPYRLTATNPAAGPCDESNTDQTAFVQGAVIDPATGQISVYNPLVIDDGSKPAAPPVVPVLPAGAVVALWFGFNGDTLTLAGADQARAAAPAVSSAVTGQPAATPAPAATGTPAPAVTGTGTGTPAASATPATPSAAATPAGQGTPAAPATPSAPATPTAADASGAATAAGSTAAGSTAAGSTAVRASVQDAGSAPIAPAPGGSAGWFNASLSRVSAGAAASSDGRPQHGRAPSPAASPSAATPAAGATSGGTPSAGTPAAGAPSGGTPSGGTAAPGQGSSGPAGQGGTPAGSPGGDPILAQANCVAGADFGSTFSSFTQVGACNAVAFFQAANAAIAAGKLKVPSPGTAKDGQACLTTRSFALIDQDQSDNVTSEYLALANGQTAQDTAANRNSLAVSGTLVNGSDNGLLDLFVDPALGCSPWQAPNLADNGAPATALPLDELQAAAWAGQQGGGPAALVPLNDPMTLDPGGHFSTAKTNTFRSLVDQPPLPAGESPRAYCSDMERIQSARLQQDVNLLMNAPSPAPAAADNLFTFLAMRLQESFTNLNCGAFGLTNEVSTTASGNGVVVAACFAHQVAPATAGPGNPMAGKRACPAVAGRPAPAPSASARPCCQHGYGRAQPTGMPSAVRKYYRHHHHG